MLTPLIQDLKHVAVTEEKEKEAGLRPSLLSGRVQLSLDNWEFLILLLMLFGLLLIVRVHAICVVVACSCHVLLCWYSSGFTCLQTFIPDWLKRTVALLWYRTFKGGLLVCCLVSLCITVPFPFRLFLCPLGFRLVAFSSFRQGV